jgi:hypothetical protein
MEVNLKKEEDQKKENKKNIEIEENQKHIKDEENQKHIENEENQILEIKEDQKNEENEENKKIKKEENHDKKTDKIKFKINISGIKDPEEDKSSESENELNNMGPGIKELLFSKSSQGESLVSRNLEEIDKDFENSSVSSKRNNPMVDSSIRSDQSEPVLTKKITIQGPLPPNIRIEKVIIKKPQVVPLMEIRARVRNDPLFQISYQKLKQLGSFQYDDQKIDGIYIVEQWIPLNKEKNYKGFVDEQQVPKGNGVLLQRGRIYQGGFLAGKKHGLGRLITPLGRVYEGYWFKGRKQGFGVFTSETETYCGDWLKGLYHGLGVLENSQGCYDGEFIFGICEGQGILHFKDGSSFSGHFKNGNLKFGTEISYDEWKEGVKKTLEITTTKKVTPHLDPKPEEIKNSPESSISNSDSEVDIPHEID